MKIIQNVHKSDKTVGKDFRGVFCLSFTNNVSVSFALAFKNFLKQISEVITTRWGKKGICLFITIVMKCFVYSLTKLLKMRVNTLLQPYGW